MDILTEVNSDVDYETCDTLVDDGILDSFDIVSIVGELNDTFDIEITPVDIVPENFNSAEAMWEMIQRLSDNQLAFLYELRETKSVLRVSVCIYRLDRGTDR